MAARVVAKYKSAGFVPDKFWRAQKAELRKILLEDISASYGRPRDVAYLLRDRLVPFFKRFHEALLNFGMHRFVEQSLKDRIAGLLKEIDGFIESYSKFSEALASAYPTVTSEDELVVSISVQMTSYFEARVKNLRDALKGQWSADARTIRALAQRWLKKAPPAVIKALEEELASPDHIPSNDAIHVKYSWLHSMGLDRVHPTRDTKRTKLDPLKWIDFLQEVAGSVYTEPSAFTEFDLDGVKVVIDDSTVDEMDIKRYVHYFNKAHALLKAKRLDKVWYGTIFVQCEDCGGVNPNDPKGGTGGNFSWGTDVVRVFVRPGSYVVQLIAHELGHRYWFKFMHEEQRGKFESLVRVKSEPPVKLDTYQLERFEGTIKDARKALAEYIDFVPKKLKDFAVDFDHAENYEPPPGATATAEDEIAQVLQSFSTPLPQWVSFPGAPSPREFKHPMFEGQLQAEYAAADKSREALIEHLEQTAKIPGVQEWEPSKAREGLRQLRKWLEETWKLQAAYLLHMTSYIDKMENLSRRQVDPKDPRPVPAVSTYGQSNIAEAFAEVFSHYVIGYDMTRDQLESFREVLASGSARVVAKFLESVDKRTGRAHALGVMKHFL
jgi:hypothetical protein